jgi:hypothetical protein
VYHKAALYNLCAATFPLVTSATLQPQADPLQRELLWAAQKAALKNRYIAFSYLSILSLHIEIML